LFPVVTAVTGEQKHLNQGAGKAQVDAIQGDFSANHVLKERRRREKLNEKFIILRSLVPFMTKVIKYSLYFYKAVFD
jgi:hypothetical protein